MTRAAVAVLALCVGLSAAQEPLSPEARKKALLEGTHVFRRILHDHGFEALDSIDDVSAEPGKTLLVVLGDLDVLTKIPGGLEQFLTDGGAALLASDRKITDPDAHRAVSKVAGVTISGDPILSPGAGYLGSDFCPFLFLPGVGATPNLFDDTAHGVPLRAVATNVPSMLFVTGRIRGITPLLVLPSDSLLDAGPRGLFRLPRAPLFAVGGESDSGRLLVLADHSVFINEMMLPEDTGNVEFAYNCVRYLQEGKRNRVLFLEDGKVQTRLAIPMKSPRISPEELLSILYARRNEMLIEAERWLARQEDDDNALERRLVDAVERRVGWTTLFFGAVIAATFVGLLFVGYRLGLRDRYGPDRSTPLLLSAAGKALPAGPLTEQRVEALLAIGDVRETLRDLARRWLTDVGLTPPASAKVNLPPVATKGWWAGWMLRRRLGRVWQLAAGTWPGKITPRALAGWQRELDELRSAHDRGEWHARNSG